jgi:hypothetical protein
MYTPRRSSDLDGSMFNVHSTTYFFFSSSGTSKEGKGNLLEYEYGVEGIGIGGVPPEKTR